MCPYCWDAATTPWLGRWHKDCLLDDGQDQFARACKVNVNSYGPASILMDPTLAPLICLDRPEVDCWAADARSERMMHPWPSSAALLPW
jgi:hypothetical protein